jgi:hypothetical protein
LQKHPNEFGKCHGRELLTEVQREVEALEQVELKMKVHHLAAGDILFRYLPEDLDSEGRSWLNNLLISPAQMWREFLNKEGLWGEQDAVWIGVQHKGKLYQHIDFRSLEVGLKAPPDPL